MEMNEKELDKVAGGTVVETKGGKFVLTPPHAKEFDTKEAAEEAEKKFMRPHHNHGKGHHFGHEGRPHHGHFPKDMSPMNPEHPEGEPK